MKTHKVIQLIWTAMAASFLMLAAFALSTTHVAWLGAPFYAPGLLIASIFVHGNAGLGDLSEYLQVAFVLNFLFIWIFLLAVSTVVEQRVLRANLARHARQNGSQV